MKKRLVCAVIAWIAVLIWCGVIYSFSADNAEESSKKSGEVVDFVAGVVVPDYEHMTPEEKIETQKTLSLPIRKLAHFTEYAILGVLTVIAVGFTPKLENTVFKITVPLAMGIVYAAFDEYHQSFVDGRAPAFTDVCIDSAGVVFGMALVFGICILRQISFNGKEKKSEK